MVEITVASFRHLHKTDKAETGFDFYLVEVIFVTINGPAESVDQLHTQGSKLIDDLTDYQMLLHDMQRNATTKRGTQPWESPKTRKESLLPPLNWQTENVSTISARRHLPSTAGSARMR
ncbi:hypothetical protein [Sulfuricella sp. T08]|uniref:hypothetical protein n=1 Tax=Sulfuricella sp. T08 TaxID=1632857 RepID=UPI0011847924|nr:hypothetical protein [Sulfuricella sp. T08]